MTLTLNDIDNFTVRDFWNYGYTPSKSGNIENERKIIRLLLSKDFVTSIVVDRERLLSLKFD